MQRTRKTALALVLSAALFAAAPLAACSKPSLSAPEEPAEEETPLPPEGLLPEETPPEEALPEEDDGDEEAEPSAARASYVAVLTDGLNVRTGASTGARSLGQVERGVLLHHAGEVNGWYVTAYLGQTAYVSANAAYTALLTLEAGDERTEAVIGYGLLSLGSPYVYGAVRLHDGRGNKLKGFSNTRFDCSSLTQYMFYYGAGVLLDVTTRTQVVQGEAVAREDLARGDLLFFTNASRYHRTGIERVGHVAVYLGENYILHTASDYAKIEEISPQRWKYYLTARRM